MEDDDAIAGRKVSYTRAGCCHHSGCFVAKDARRSQKVVFDLFEIRMADPAALHADQ
jgi:hypothetical protein